MKYPVILALLALVALTAGCASRTASNSRVRSEIVVTPPPAPPLNEAGVWLPDGIKAYPVGRYVDPADPNIMHERHVLYRREQQGDWRLQTNADRQILIGNTMGDGEQDLKPALLDQELARELQRQRANGLAARQSAVYLVEKGAEMSDAAKALMEQEQQLRQKLEEERAKNKTLQSELDGEKSRRRQQEQNSAIDPATGLPRSGR